MDHLPQVKEPVHGHACPVVPHLRNGVVYGSHARGHDGFRAFMENAAAEESPALLQSWLYFGLLAESFGHKDFHFDYHDFLDCAETGSVRVTTRHLNRYAWYWVAMTCHESRDHVEAHAESLDKCLKTANTVMNNVVARCNDESMTTSSWSPVVLVHLSIFVLAEFLCDVRRRIVKDSPSPDLQWDFPFLDKILLGAGWCPAEIPMLRRDCNITCRYYLGTIDRWVLGRDHRGCTADSADGCRAFQIQFSTYKTKHRPDCLGGSSCRFIGPQPGHLTGSLQAPNSFPVVRFTSTKAGTGSVQVYPMDSGIKGPFVAISHVWSDGLGNPQSNALPLCQLNHIETLVNALYDPDDGPVNFWMDTLCIPVGRKNVHFRKLAISRIAHLFKRADKVLVLDNSLQNIGSDAPWEEKGVRLMYSAWMNRVWTFLEGRVNGSLWFQFKGGAFLADQYTEMPKRLQGLPAVSEILKAQGFDRVRGNINSIRLARALAMYDLDSMTKYLGGTYTYTQEDRDLYRSENPHQAEIHGTWKPFIINAGLEQELSDVDEELRNDIGVISLCSVVQKSMTAYKKVSGTQYPLYVEQQRDLDSGAQQSASPVFFGDICGGFQGRTTSRKEDETVCIALLAGVDTMEIEDIRPLQWRLREWLSWAEAYVPLHILLSSLGISIRTWLDDCHERRMKVLLSRIGQFQEEIVLWNAPRLRGLGWKWAPFSVLGPELDVSARQLGRWAKIRDEGLEVRLAGIRLSWTPDDLRWRTISDAAALDTPFEEEVLLYIHCDETCLRRVPQSWHHVRVLLQSPPYPNPWKDIKTWCDVLRSGLINRLIILYTIKHGISLACIGALVEEYGIGDDSVHLTNHRVLVKKATGDLDKVQLPVIHVAGTTDYKSTWCVG